MTTLEIYRPTTPITAFSMLGRPAGLEELQCVELQARRTLGPPWSSLSPEDIGRRAFIAGAAAVFTVAGCEQGPGTSSSSERGLTTFVDGTGATVKVPAKPQRIIALHPVQVAPLLLSLKARVVGIAADPGPWNGPLDLFDTTGIPQLGSSNDIDIERVIELQPDLIVGYTTPAGEVAQLEPTTIERLRKIAPTAFISNFPKPADRLPHDVITRAAKLVGADPQLIDAQRRRYERLVAQVAGLLGPKPGEVTFQVILFFEDGNEFEFRTRDNSDTFAHVLEAADAVWSQGPVADRVSLERLRDVSADLLITGTYRADYTNSPLYGSLAVVRAGQAIEAPKLYGSVSYPNYIEQAKFLVEQLTKIKPLRADIVP
jgi:iron complex transport system substrate-binding protein